MDIPHDTNVLVLDGRKLLLFKNEGGSLEPKLVLQKVREKLSAPTHEQGTARPGRTHESLGASRSSTEETDLHQQDEDLFAAEAAGLVNREVLGGEIKALIVVAAPKTLGALRKHYRGLTRACLVGEIAKEAAGHTTADIVSIISHS